MPEKKVSKIAEFRKAIKAGKSVEEAIKESGVSKGTAAVQLGKIKKEVAEAQ